MAAFKPLRQRRVPLLQSDPQAFQAGFKTCPFAGKGLRLFMPGLACNAARGLRAEVVAGHCLPVEGGRDAHDVNAHRAVLADGARVFGATIVQGDAPRSKAAQALMDYYNRKGIFSNALDTAPELEAELKRRFTNVRVQLHGAVAVFDAQVE